MNADTTAPHITSSPITFANAKRSDLPFIVDVYNQTIPSKMVTADTTLITVDSRINWFDSHNAKTRPLWLLKYNHKPCGWISLSTFYEREAYDKTVEISLYIQQDFRGKQIGQYIVKQIEQHAKDNGIETTLSYVFAHNKPSLFLFKKMGYQEWGFLPKVAQLDNVKRDLIILGKHL